jgi:hypothetical protein
MLSRYESDESVRGGIVLATAAAVDRIRQAQRAGQLPTRDRILRDGERLDFIAGKEFGNSSLWWVIAATSNIGWWLQVPPGTILKIPTDVNRVLELI